MKPAPRKRQSPKREQFWAASQTEKIDTEYCELAMRWQSPVKLQNQTVLCIDDDEDLLDCEKDLLESFGYSVLTAPSGGKGLELAASHSVDVVVVDYCMPEMNGQDVAIEMRRLRPQAPIIMLSGATDIPQRALQSVDAFVAKDHLAGELLAAIAQLQQCHGFSLPELSSKIL